MIMSSPRFRFTKESDMLTRNVLLFEANPQTRLYVKDILDYFSFNVQTAETWDEAEQHLQHGDYDVMIVDEAHVHLGHATPVRWIRERGSDLPIIIMSYMPLPELWSNCLEHDGVELISNPFSPSELKLMLDIVTSKRIRKGSPELSSEQT